MAMKTKEIAEDAIVGREDFCQIQVQVAGQASWQEDAKPFATTDGAKQWFYDMMSRGLLAHNPDGTIAKYRVVRTMTIQMLEVDLVK
jgi:hypothetical protein